MAKAIRIVLHPDGKLGPDDGPLTRVTAGETVRFIVPPGSTDASIEFTGASPFGDSEAAKKPRYGDEVAVVKTSGRFVYTCRATIGGVKRESPGGGEIEIGPPGQ